MSEVQRIKIGQILREISFSSPVLDIGSGPGFLEEKISAVALDVNLDDLKKFHGQRILASGDHLPFVGGHFNTVFCIDTAHLLKKPEETVRVLRPNGKLIASLPCNKWNCENKLRELMKKFHMLKPMQKIIIKTEREWDAVVVFVKVRSFRKARTAR
jgi:SAM-dependent methyltransferase